MRARHVPFVLLLALGGFACGGSDEDGDASEEGGSGSDGTAGSGGEGGSSGSSGSPGADLDDSAQASELSASEVADLCAALDDAAGLTGDVEAGCQAEAWLWTFDPQECEQIIVLCNDAGATMLGLELPAGCSQQGAELEVCEVTVGELIACAQELGEFWATRTCEEDNLTADGPSCDIDFQTRCPSLFGSASSGGGS
jgi:hypothetical protein